MAAILSGSSPATSPSPIGSPSNNPNHPSLPPLITSPPARRSTIPRPMSHASKNRLSQYSATSIPTRSRPPSHVFPVYLSSLAYTLVRDFAYPAAHPMHFGPPSESSRPPSGTTTPSLDDTSAASCDGKTSFGSWGGEVIDRLGGPLPMQFADGPPWSEDEDLQSPVVSSRHRKNKSSPASYGRRRGSRDTHSGQSGSMLNPTYDGERVFYLGTNGDGNSRYHVNQAEDTSGPDGEYVTYPPGQMRHAENNCYGLANQQPRQYMDPEATCDSDDSSDLSSPDYFEEDQSRYSRDYQFTITSPDEEMHGKAVALFDFERENENELPLVEGQIIWVSYRHGQGWLVAEDPKTQESGLVPEEYVRLLRDIEGGMKSLTGHLTEAPASPKETGTPTPTESQSQCLSSAPSNASNGYHQPVVSTFSTSSKDLHPYPQHLLGTQVGQAPPQVVHYHGQRGGSQANTPTLPANQDAGLGRGSLEGYAKKREPGLETLQDAKMEPPTSPEEQPTSDRYR